MIDIVAGQSMYEVSVILDNTDKRLIQRIPKKVLKTIKEKARPTKEFIYDKNKKLKDQDITKATKGIIAMIYRDYLCTEEQRLIYKEYYATAIEAAELEKKEKYNVDNIFSARNSKEEHTELIPYEKESIWQKIKNKFMKIFKRRKEW